MKSKAIENKVIAYTVVAFMCVVALMLGLHNRSGLDADTNYSIESDNGIIQKGKSIKVRWESAGKINKKKVKWSISNNGVASISISKSKKSVTVKGKKEGSTRVALRYKGKYIGSVKLFVSNNSLSNKKVTISCNKPKTLKIKSFMKVSNWSKYGDIEWYSSNDIVRLDTKNYGQQCKVSCTRPGSCKITAKQGKHVIGSVTVNAPATEKIDINSSRYISNKKGVIKINGADFVNTLSNNVKYEISMKVGEYLATDGSSGVAIKLITPVNKSIFTCFGNVVAYSFIQPIEVGEEEVIVEDCTGKKYKVLVKVSEGNRNDTYSDYEYYLRDLCKSVEKYDSEFLKVVNLVKQISNNNYVEDQRDRFVLSSTGEGNCVAGGLILVDACKKLGIESGTLSVMSHYSEMKLSVAITGDDHCIEWCIVDGKKIITDATPRGWEGFHCFDYEEAENGNWVYPECFKGLAWSSSDVESTNEENIRSIEELE